MVFILIFTTISPCFALSEENKNSEKKWTYIFYDAHDYTHNWLEPMFFRPITRPRSDRNLNFIVLQDTIYGPGKIFHINRFGRKILKENLGEINMGNSSTLEYILSYCKENYPAERYFLEIASHGTAWYASGLDETSNDDWLTMKEIQKALTNVGGVDIIAFIASCAMASLESVYELRELTDVYIGCQEAVAFDPYVYNPIYTLLRKQTDLSSIEIGKRIIELVEEVENNPKLYFYKRDTISAMRTDKVADLVYSINNLTVELLKDLGGNFDNLKSVHKKTQQFFDDDLIDIYDYAKNFLEVEGINENITICLKNIMDELNETVIYEYHKDAYPGANGLTLYFPYWGGYQWFLPENYYSEFGLEFTNDTYWDEFLIEYDNLFPRVDDDGKADYITIKDAIDNCTEGDIIYVLNGTYNENIEISKKIFLVGESRYSTKIVGDFTKDVVTINADKAKILYFNISNSSADGAGVKVNADYVEVRFCNVKNSNIGIYLKDSNNGVISGNNIFNNKLGIYLFDSHLNKIRKNIFKNNNRDAFFTNSIDNMWDNKFSDHPNKNINIIFGEKKIGKISIPTLRLDRHRIYVI
jgi:parallel beta-helix repeat protein